METKQRHGCVTVWLILMIVLNSVTALVYLFAGDFVSQNFPGELSNGILLALALLGTGNVVFAVLLFKWKMAGFWGFVITGICALVVNLNIGLGIGQSLLGLVGIAVLYGVLQIKKEDKSAWSNLE